MVIVNLTQHPATPEQVEAGVVDLPPEMRERLVTTLTFSAIPERADLLSAASRIYMMFEDFCIAVLNEDFSGDWKDWPRALIGGAPWMMPVLEAEFHGNDTDVVYAFSRRESVEEVMPDGSVRKSSVFRHLGFMESLCSLHHTKSLSGTSSNRSAT